MGLELGTSQATEGKQAKTFYLEYYKFAKDRSTKSAGTDSSGIVIIPKGYEGPKISIQVTDDDKCTTKLVFVKNMADLPKLMYYCEGSCHWRKAELVLGTAKKDGKFMEFAD